MFFGFFKCAHGVDSYAYSIFLLSRKYLDFLSAMGYTGRVNKGNPMSTDVNTILIEKAYQIAEMYTGTPLEDAILNNIERGDLEKVAELVRQTENHLMAEAFNDKN